MNALLFDPKPMDELVSLPSGSPEEWLWEGFLARGNITLLTSQWKEGKTTLLTGLLRAFGAGGSFLDRACRPATAVVVSEESPALWTARQKAIPIGAHVRLVSRPFLIRPTPEQWDELVVHAECLRADGKLDLFVVDPLAAFLPGKSDSDPGTLLQMLHPLRRLAQMGVAVLVLHHPRKQPSEAGSASRGSGALLGFVDVILEMSRCSRLECDANRRKLAGFSRHTETPVSLVYEWTPGTPEFRAVADMHATRFRENWKTVEAILTERHSPATHKELLADWPPDQIEPSPRQLYEWLSRAVRDQLAIRIGNGTRKKPFRFSLNSDTCNATSKLPDLPPLPPLDMFFAKYR